MGFRFLTALLLVTLVSSGCVVVVNYTGDAAADLDLIFDLSVDAKLATDKDLP